MADTAKDMGISRQYLSNRFRTFWYIPTPDPVDPHRIFDQIFIDDRKVTNWKQAINQMAVAYPEHFTNYL